MRRDLEIEEPSNRYFIHPIAGGVCTLCARWGITPNTVSLGGMALGLLSGLAYSHYLQPGACIIGFCLMLGWHVMDGADGQLARLTHAQSEFGKVMDGICDYVTFIAVYTGLAMAMARHDSAWVVLFILLAGICHAAQAAAYEAQRQDYVFWGWGRGSKPPSLRRPGQARGVRGVFALLLGINEGLQNALGRDRDFDRALATRFDADPAGSENIRARYRARFAPAVKNWSILSSNHRTPLIFLCALLHLPVLYFGIEIFCLSPVTFLLARRQKAMGAAFLAELNALQEMARAGSEI